MDQERLIQRDSSCSGDCAEKLLQPSLLSRMVLQETQKSLSRLDLSLLGVSFGDRSQELSEFQKPDSGIRILEPESRSVSGDLRNSSWLGWFEDSKMSLD